MKRTTAWFGLLILLLGCDVAFSQGSLTPPAAPTPTMKTLDQIQARTPIGAAAFTINSSGSYYLTQNITVATGDAITINASNVTLDLNGFTISSTANPASGNGITISGNPHNITIVNGNISGGITFSGGTFTTGPGFFDGILSPGTPTNVQVRDINISGCTVGINLATTGAIIVTHCIVNTAAGTGIKGTIVSDCIADVIGGSAILAETATNCHGAAATNGVGINTNVANNCFGQSATGTGISVTTVASHCRGVATGAGTAISAPIAFACSATGATGFSATTHQYFCGSGANPFP